MRSFIYFPEHAKVEGRKTAVKKNGRPKNYLPSNHILKVISIILYFQTDQLSKIYKEGSQY